VSMAAATGYEQDLLRQASLDPAAFAWLASRGQWQVAPHLDLLAERLLDVAQGKLKRLLIQMPPRHGKSEFASAHFPAWYLGTFPDRRVILASYEHGFAASWGGKARDRFAGWGPALWRLWLRKDKQAADDWGIAGHSGGMVCAGVGGPITGRGADLLVVDDPVKSAEEANSGTYRNRAWDWYRSTAYTRLEPGGAILLIQTRWHEDDLAGRVMAEAAKTGEQWHVISLPALAEANDALGRQPGGALWPPRYPVEQLEQIRASIGPYWWQALYQQRPAPPEGALFQQHWWRYWEQLPEPFEEMLLSVDASYKAGADNSFTTIGVWGRKGADCYLIHQWRKQCGFVEAKDAVAETARDYPEARIILIEDKANGRAIIESLQAVVAGIVPVDPKGGKFSRAQAVSPLVEQGHVWLPQPARLPWVQEFLAEARTFPVGAYDDQIDQMTQALQWWIWVKDQPLPSQPELTIPQQRAAMADASDRRPVGAGRSPRWRIRQ